jgi:hypothetical protein
MGKMQRRMYICVGGVGKNIAFFEEWVSLISLPFF